VKTITKTMNRRKKSRHESSGDERKDQEKTLKVQEEKEETRT